MLFEKESPKSYSKGLRAGFFCSFEVYRTAISTNMLFMIRFAHGKKSNPLAKAVRRLPLPYKKHIKTITTDNGHEFAAHELITKYLRALCLMAKGSD